MTGLQIGAHGLTVIPPTNDFVVPMTLGDKLRAALGPINIPIDEAEHHRRIDYALSLGLPSLELLTDICAEERIAVVGSGPSLAQSIDHLRSFKGKIMAVNAAHDFLLKHGIKPTFGVLLDPRDWVATYQTPTEGVIYLIGSTVHHKVWQRFFEHGVRPFVFIPVMNDTEHEDISERYDDRLCFVAGATTVGLRALNLLMHLGASVAEMHGFDSCYPPGSDGKDTKEFHAHSKPFVEPDVLPLTIKSHSGDSFSCLTNAAMARQVKGFNSYIQSMPTHMVNGRIGRFRLVVAGDGAIPWMAWKNGAPDSYLEHLTPNVMAAKYGTAKDWDYANNKAVEQSA
jgi:hypothetical protein